MAASLTAGAARRGVEQHRCTALFTLTVGVYWRERERERETDIVYTRLTNVGEGVGGGERACLEPHVSTTLNSNTDVASWRLIIAQAQRRFEDN